MYNLRMKCVPYIAALLLYFVMGEALAQKVKDSQRYAKGYVVIKFRENEVTNQVPDYRVKGMSDAVKFAVSNGVTFVTISHNDGTSNVRFPGSMRETITVGGITRTGALWSGSNWGTNLDLVAPCTNILALLRDEGWTTNAVGTSFAAPMVSGAVGLMLAVDPALNSDQIRDLLCGGADDQVSSDTNDLSGYDLHYGWGKLNIYNSLRLLMTRIDVISNSTPSTIYMSWPCTLSAATNKPYMIEWTDSIVSPLWTNNSTISYTAGLAHWTGAKGSGSNRFYRTSIKRYSSW